MLFCPIHNVRLPGADESSGCVARERRKSSSVFTFVAHVERTRAQMSATWPEFLDAFA